MVRHAPMSVEPLPAPAPSVPKVAPSGLASCPLYADLPGKALFQSDCGASDQKELGREDHMIIDDVLKLRLACAFSLLSFLALNYCVLTGRNAAADYVGIPWHLGLLIVIATVEAPGWARAMGFAWVALEFIISGAAIHGFPPAMALALRFGGAHLCTALWVVGATYRKPAFLQVTGWGLVLIHLATCLLPIPMSLPVYGAMFTFTFLWVALLAWAGEKSLSSARQVA